MFALGQVGILAGIPMWASGGSRVSKYERAQLALSAAGLQGRF